MKRALFKSGISFGSGKTYKLDKKEHEGMVYLDTPGLVDIKMRQVAARAITEALKQNGEYQIFFVVVLSAGRFRPEDLTTIWQFLPSTPTITLVNIIINKLSKGEYEYLQNKDGMAESGFLQPLEMMKIRTKCNVFLLLHDQRLADADDALAFYPKLDSFVDKALCVDVDSGFVNDIPADEESFSKQLNSVRDTINHSNSIQMSSEVRSVS